MKGRTLQTAYIRKRIVVDIAMILFAASLISVWLLFGRGQIQSRVVENELFSPNIESDVEVDMTQLQDVDSSYFETDVRKLVRLRSIDDVRKKRNELIKFLWASEQLPSDLAKVVSHNYKDQRYKYVENLSRIEMLFVLMKHDLSSKIYHFVPESSNGNIILYHQGHGGDFYLGEKVIREFLRMGYSVVGFSMPLVGINYEPNGLDVYVEGIGVLRAEDHRHIKFLYPDAGHPLQYFVEPVVQVINYLERNYEYSTLSMTGISGGGWTTTIAAAIDPRIIASFPVAGSVPIYLRSKAPEDWGDWEQTVPEFYKIANYLELYVLGGSGFGRTQLQVLNVHDDCCFRGFKSQTYGAIVRSLVHELGDGQYGLFLDRSHKRHMISKQAIALIDREIRKESN